MLKKLESAKNYIAKNKPLVAVAIVATATVAAVVIDVVMRDNSEWIDTDAIAD
jgi:hypothetical protein